MIESMISIDIELMRLLNHAIANPVFDVVMPIITHEYFVRSILVIGVLLAAWKGGRYGRITALLAVLTVILSDQLSSQLIKPAVGRIRPCHELDWVHLLVNCSSGKSFPSSHASNSFAQAVLWSIRYPRLRWGAFVLAALISFSRISVGVHYPFDVLSGAIVGSAAGITVLLVYKFGLSRMSFLSLTKQSAVSGESS
jgi:membrane-associated phospholipid phosphatase